MGRNKFVEVFSHSHGIPFLLGSVSVRHPLQTAIAWSSILAYSLALSLKQLEAIDVFAIFSRLTRYHAAYAYFLLFSFFFTILRIKKLNIPDVFYTEGLSPSEYRMVPRSFKHITTFAVLASVIIASAFSALLSRQHLLSISLCLLLADWRFLPTVIKVRQFFLG